MFDEPLSPRQVAKALGTSESSLKRWCDKGLIPSYKTGGGHRRILLKDAIEFLREKGVSIRDPEILGLTEGIYHSHPSLDQSQKLFEKSLFAAQEAEGRFIIEELHLAGHSIATIGDKIIRPSMAAIGHAWECHSLEVHQERRAVEICRNILSGINRYLPEPDEKAPLALSTTLEGDWYTLPVHLVALLLKQRGWNSMVLGESLPLETIVAAMEKNHPQAVFLSLSYLSDRKKFIEESKKLWETANRYNILLGMGGNALTESIRQEIRYSLYCDTLTHLDSFLDTWQIKNKSG